MSSTKAVAVIISDIHIGDDEGIVRQQAAKGYSAAGTSGLYVRDDFQQFLEAIGKVAAAVPGKKISYLILNGDGWDVAIKNVDEVAELSQSLFAALPVDEYFGQILFLPGNHDHHLWTMLQTQTCVVRPLEKAAGSATGPASVAKLVEGQVQAFPHEQSGLLDLATGELKIPGVKPPYDGHVFLSGLTGAKRIPINVVYPNLYLVPASPTQSILVTHGHFFEFAWRLLTEVLAQLLAREHVRTDLVNLEMLNSPLTEFFNFSLAQVGPVSTLVNRIYNQVRAGQKPPELDIALDSLATYADRAIEFHGDNLWSDFVAMLKEAGSDAAIKAVRSLVESLLMSALRDAKRGNLAVSGARHDAHFLDRQETLDFIDLYLTMSRRKQPNLEFGTVVFGHTHEAFPRRTRQLRESGEVAFWNTGGLVGVGGQCDFMPLMVDSAGNVSALA
ncbi:MAG TPA: metallophosphoesterase [Thermoanaerobaculaceae bacterium]|nr:metallophosphoesterase [Thermoanaerobaculaceae bacterium]